MEYLSFEKPIEELENQLTKAHELADETGVDMAKTITDIRQKIDDAKKEIYSNLISSIKQNSFNKNSLCVVWNLTTHID